MREREDISDGERHRVAKRARVERSERLREEDAGLLEYVHPDWRPVHAIIKQRYADFLVHEVDESGQVVHITSLEPPAPLPQAVPAPVTAAWEDLRPYFGDRFEALRMLVDDKALPPVDSLPLPEKQDRTRVHQLVRALAGETLVSEAIMVGDASVIRVAHQPPRSAHRGGRGRQPRDDPTSEAASAPPYIHFTLQKTNRDSQEALHWLARFFKLDSRGRASSTQMLSVAGTKDKRAVTVQRVALQRGRRTLAEVWDMANHIGQPLTSDRNDKRKRTQTDALTTRAERGLRVAHLAYATEPLQLGQLQGNQFTITLRDVRWADAPSGEAARAGLRDALAAHVASVEKDGFINYFGMQRFGTGTISTHTIGLAVLRGDFDEALRLVLAPSEAQEKEEQSEDGAPPSVLATREAQALVAEKRYADAYQRYPKTSVAERAVLEKMKAPHWAPSDPLGAFQNIPRTLRLMYVHAYQSYLWNRLASERVRRFGALQPVVGDMVEEQGTYRVLSMPDEASACSMDDVVIPMPGAEVQPPAGGWLAELYESLLAADGLTPLSLATARQPEYRLKGAYRRLVHKPRAMSCELLSYSEVDAPLCATDEEALLPDHAPPCAAPAADDDAPFLALKLQFQLPSSAYATVLLRELLRTDTSSHVHKAMTKQSAAAAVVRDAGAVPEKSK